MAIKILVVDDEKLIRWSVRERLKTEGYEVLEACDGASAGPLIVKPEFQLALLDFRLPDTTGAELMAKIQHAAPGLPIIIMTAYSSINGAVDAIKAGAVNYVTKPFSMDDLAEAVRKALSDDAERRTAASEITDQKARFGLANIVGESRRIQEIKDLVRRVARSETTTVLLLGESGCGKDMLARAIHYESSRVDKPFVNVTCTALPESLLESELFGYEKGAFTDAKVQKKGLFEFAGGGTVFLDEIADMWPALQAKLLRVLEEKAFKRVGGTTDVTVDVRIIAATNRNIDDAIQQGRFREDLYYRLSTVPVLVPPLRERKDDIALLAQHFLKSYNREFRRNVSQLAPEAIRRLHQYDWPGNVRELKNVIERAVLLSSGDTITSDDIFLGRMGIRAAELDKYPVQLPEGGCRLADVEKELMRQALERTNWNQTHAAELLGITRDQVRYKMAKYDLQP